MIDSFIEATFAKRSLNIILKRKLALSRVAIERNVQTYSTVVNSGSPMNPLSLDIYLSLRLVEASF